MLYLAGFSVFSSIVFSNQKVYNSVVIWRYIVTTSNMVRELCEKKKLV